MYQLSSVQFSCSVVSDSLWPNESQHARPPCPSPTPRIHSDSRRSSQWCHPAISSSVIPFPSCPQSLPASESFPMSQLFAGGGQSTGVWASASFLPKKSQGWSGMGEFNSDDHYIYYCEQKSLRRNGVAIIVNKRVRNAVLGCNLKNDRMISVRFQGKSFNITVIQAYAPTSNAEEAEVERVLWRPTRPFRTNTQKRCPFHYRGLECKSRKSKTPGVTGKFGLGTQNEAGKG